MKIYVYSFFVFLLTLFLPITKSSSGIISSEYRRSINVLIEKDREEKLRIQMFNDSLELYTSYSKYENLLELNKVDYQMYRNVLAHRESSGDYTVVNRLGYMGRYQFGKKTLKTLRKLNLINFQNKDISRNRFTSNKPLQESCLIALTLHNNNLLKTYMDKYAGNYVNGVRITKEGMLAGAHLRGYYSVVLFLVTDGRVNLKDANKTSVRDYLKLFS